MTPTPFDTARARIVARDYPGLPSELLLAAVERLEALGDVSAPAGIIGELAKRLPPPREAGALEHIAYALAVAPTLTQAVRALDTGGLGLSHWWPIAATIPVSGSEAFGATDVELRVFYCAGCAALHRRLTFSNARGSVHHELDLDHDTVSTRFVPDAGAALEDDHELELIDALSWSLDVLRIALNRIDAVDGQELSREHYAIRSEGLAKAWKALHDAQARRRSRELDSEASS